VFAVRAHQIANLATLVALVQQTVKSKFRLT